MGREGSRTVTHPGLTAQVRLSQREDRWAGKLPRRGSKLGNSLKCGRQKGGGMGLASGLTGLAVAGQTMEGTVIRNLRPDGKILNHNILRSDFHFQTITLAAGNGSKPLTVSGDTKDCGPGGETVAGNGACGGGFLSALGEPAVFP